MKFSLIALSCTLASANASVKTFKLDGNRNLRGLVSVEQGQGVVVDAPATESSLVVNIVTEGVDADAKAAEERAKAAAEAEAARQAAEAQAAAQAAEEAEAEAARQAAEAQAAEAQAAADEAAAAEAQAAADAEAQAEAQAAAQEEEADQQAQEEEADQQAQAEEGDVDEQGQEAEVNSYQAVNYNSVHENKSNASDFGIATVAVLCAAVVGLFARSMTKKESPALLEHRYQGGQMA